MVYSDMINQISKPLLILAVGGLMFTGSAIAQATISTSGPDRASSILAVPA
jgi:hypothetical protein